MTDELFSRVRDYPTAEELAYIDNSSGAERAARTIEVDIALKGRSRDAYTPKAEGMRYMQQIKEILLSQNAKHEKKETDK